jgi:2-hydroxychromene-2-carboxylate isomerase
MTDSIDFYFDFASPYSYLASTQLGRLTEGTRAKAVYRPIRISEVMKLVGNTPTTLQCRNKGRYARADLARWAARYGIGIQPNPHMGSIDFAGLLRGALVAGETARPELYVDAVFRAVWAQARNLGDRQVLLGVLDEAGLDGTRILSTAAEEPYAAALEKSGVMAAERGLFGVPTFFVGNDMFFGNDRLDFVAAALRAAA